MEERLQTLLAIGIIGAGIVVFWAILAIQQRSHARTDFGAELETFPHEHAPMAIVTGEHKRVEVAEPNPSGHAKILAQLVRQSRAQTESAQDAAEWAIAELEDERNALAEALDETRVLKADFKAYRQRIEARDGTEAARIVTLEAQLVELSKSVATAVSLALVAVARASGPPIDAVDWIEGYETDPPQLLQPADHEATLQLVTVAR